MSRSLKKGPFVDAKVLKKVLAGKRGDTIKTWARACTITPEMVGFNFSVHNGKTFIAVSVTEQMVGHRLGEFSPTRKFLRHGGKMAKEQAASQAQAEKAKLAAAKTQTQPIKKK